MFASPKHLSVVAAWLALSLCLARPDGAEARCRSVDDLTALGRVVRTHLGCGEGDGGPDCPRSVPACGARVLADLAALAGPTPGEVLDRTAAGRCRRALVRSAGSFAERRLHERARGLRATRGGRIVGLISRACHGVHVEAAPSALGGPCAPPAGRAIDGPSLARCVRASVERLVDDVAPRALRPNIVLVLTDDQRWDTVGYMPATFSRLAGEGLAFRNAFATTPACSPSRASIYTGRIARNHGVRRNGEEPAFDASATIATALSEVGYHNGFFGKYLNGAENLGLERPPGWSAWNVFLRPSGGSYFGSRLNEDGVVRELPDDAYSTDVLGARARRFIRENAKRPFFLVYAPYAPHEPFEPAPRHQGVLAGLPPHRPPNWREPDLSLKPIWVRFFMRIAGPDSAAARDVQRLRELETLLAVDEAVDGILDTLEREGLTDETLVVFTSDHGIHWGEHWSGTKFTSYEESIRMPLLARYPARAPRPASVIDLVANVDLAPTFADAAGARLAGPVDGASLMPFFSDAAAPPPGWRDQVAIDATGGLITRPSRALRTAGWKYIENEVDDGVAVELYDMVADPWELRNLAFDPTRGEVRASMADRLEAELPR